MNGELRAQFAADADDELESESGRQHVRPRMHLQVKMPEDPVGGGGKVA